MSTDRTAPSRTAQRVAAYRRMFDRMEAASGDPSADDRLADDVIGPDPGPLDENMVRYLRGRTSFFDRVVVNALDRGIAQMVSVGAGYDARALRYARPGVRWFELDHPVTQDDKRERLHRLGIETGDLTFIAVDLAEDDITTALLDHGYEPEVPSVLSCEGLAAYLDPPVLGRMLSELRAVATVGTRLAISLSSSDRSKDHADRRRRLDTAVAALGEPTRSRISGAEATELLAVNRWRTVELSERAARVGFVVATPLWEPLAATGTGPSPTAIPPSRLGAYMERTFSRTGTDGLAGHLESRYGIAVARVRELDVGVFRVERTDGPAWIARVFPAARALRAVEEEAAILRTLGEAGFPAEQPADAQAVSTLVGQGVLITELVPGKPAGADRATYVALGALLGQLHTLSGPWIESARSGGAWHHLALEGGPQEEIAALDSLLEISEPRVPRGEADLFAHLCEEVRGIDVGCDLPTALIHPDFVPANAVVAADGPVMIDWAGVGRGPRLWSLGLLLWAGGHHHVRDIEAIIDAYGTHVTLDTEERRRLAGVILARPLVFEAWAWCTGRKKLAEVVETIPELRRQADAIAARAVEAIAR